MPTAGYPCNNRLTCLSSDHVINSDTMYSMSGPFQACAGRIILKESVLKVARTPAIEDDFDAWRTAWRAATVKALRFVEVRIEVEHSFCCPSEGIF